MFRKTARVASLGTFDVETDGAVRVAQRATDGEKPAIELGHDAPRSYYLDGARKLDVRALLEKVADLYGVSARPEDYFFEAIRANTTNAANENNDGFHQSELLRFDVKLGMPVYMTYAGKPHHLNHKTENPKAARGVIIDAHYNSDSPALDTCPCCTTRTAERQNRDETGLHCKKCGTLVKDEFVEILVGIDAKKDPLFADGVRKGTLKAGSMGCNCLSTICNVCSHVAYSRPEFCEHIRAGNKGTMWMRKGQGWVKTSSSDIAKALRQQKLSFVPHDFCYVKTANFEARRAFEYCIGVIFDEYSRVDQPADPKALQVEILKAASFAGIPDTADLRAETEALIRSADRKRKELEARMHFAASRQKAAGKFFVVRVNQDPSDTHAGRTLEEAMGLAQADNNDHIEYGIVDSQDVGAARLMEPQGWMPVPEAGLPGGAEGSMDQSGIGIQLEQGDEPLTIQPPGSGGMPGQQPGAPGPGGPGGGPQSIDQYTDQQVPAPGQQPPPGEEMDLGEMGVLPIPPGASAPRRGGRRPDMHKFSNAYEKWTVQVSEQGNARLLTHERTPVLVFKAEKATQDPEERKAFGLEVLGHLLSAGLVATAKKYKAFFSPKFAQVVEGGMNDMQNFKDHYQHSSVIEGAPTQDDMAGNMRGKPPGDVTSGGVDVMQGDVRGKPITNVEDGGVMDHEVKDQGIDSAVGEDHETMREKRKPFNMGKNTVLQNEVHDHKEPLSGKKGEVELNAALVGSRVAQKLGADSFLVTAARLTDKGLEFELVGPDKKTYKAAASMLETWLALDKGPGTLKLPGQPAQATVKWSAAQIQALREQGIAASIDQAGNLITAAGAEKCGDCGKLMFGGKEKHSCMGAKGEEGGDKEAQVTLQARIAAAEKLEKIAQAKLAKADKAIEQAKVAGEDMARVAAEAAVASFARALRIAAARQGVDLEQSPLKLAAEAVLSESRPIGKDAATGAPIMYKGLDPELTRYLVAQVYNIGHGDHLEQLMRRASELMGKGDQYLIDAETDLKNVNASLPEITNARTAELDEVGLNAMELRAQARQGNLRFTPAPTEAVNANGHDKRAAIRGALGGTLVEAARGRLGLN